MKLRINGTLQELTPIKAFREAHQLPESFRVSLFEPKDYAGLGSIEQAGSTMNSLRDNVLNMIPTRITLPDLIEFVDFLQLQFQSDLFNINDMIALHDVEVEFAVAGFGDVLRTMIYAMIPAHTSKQEMPSFEAIYYGWINDSVRVSSQIHLYAHQGNEWQIQVINHVYGRAGLVILAGDESYYVSDGLYLCPAEGFMYTLLKDIALKLWQVIA